MKYSFRGKIIMIGYGIIARAVLPLIRRHISPENIMIINGSNCTQDNSIESGIKIVSEFLTKENWQHVLKPLIKAGDCVVNLSVGVSSVDLVRYCHTSDVFYLDACIEPWGGSYSYLSPDKPLAQRTNYQLRESVLQLRQELQKKFGEPGTTALVAHGANPGLVSCLLKKALVDIAEFETDDKHFVSVPSPSSSREEWATFARDLNVQAIHISERDTQASKHPKAVNEFVNTWSAEGFISEACQPAELGWGTHEEGLPEDGCMHETGCRAAIFLNRPGLSVQVRSWVPTSGAYHGFLITHNESISIADYFTLVENNQVIYRPTVMYAYHPANDTVLSLHQLYGRQMCVDNLKKRVMMEDIMPGGMDELGVLVMGQKGGAYWYGSQLSIDEARGLVKDSNATSLQVAAAVFAGIVWIIENPHRGIVESDEVDYQRILAIASPYLGKLVGKRTDWTPLKHRNTLFQEKLNIKNPWAFSNVIVR